MPQLVQAEIISQIELRPGFFLMELGSQALALAAQPGQFLHIRCGQGHDPLLRRPISIHGVDRVQGIVQILFQVVGRGTRLLAGGSLKVLDVLGPLGRGFTLPGTKAWEDHEQPHVFGSAAKGGKPGKFIVVGGGIGVAPLYFLMQELKNIVDMRRISVLMGASTAQCLLIRSQVERLGLNLQIATDDGSVGHQGTVVDILADVLAPPNGHGLPPQSHYVYACGPKPMLKAVCRLLKQTGVAGQVSVEEKMACGLGACLSCACQVQDGSGAVSYQRACVEGPVFAAQEVVFDD